jgi:hypothetical protein
MEFTRGVSCLLHERVVKYETLGKSKQIQVPFCVGAVFFRPVAPYRYSTGFNNNYCVCFMLRPLYSSYVHMCYNLKSDPILKLKIVGEGDAPIARVMFY